ncbi:ABC transporter ATP-binding protein [Streptomyces sp. NPDC059010]|uniref:ABC transporter ATP-binding protein n=1 Tax=Streptomyces sp. NPDC059010 TaxID=3346695 RepID=UPI0036BA35E9
MRAARFALWLTLLRRCRQVAPRATLALAGFIAAGSAAVALLAVSVRSLVDSAVRSDQLQTLTAAVGATVCLLVVHIGSGTREALRGTLSERVGMEIDQEIIATVTGLHRLEHLERPAYLDRVSLVLGSGPNLVAAAWVPLESVGSVIGIGASAVLLAQVHPVLLLLLPCAALPLLLHRHAQRGNRAASLAAAQPARREEHLFSLLTSAASAKEIMATGAGGRLRELRAAAWREATDTQHRARLRGALLTSAGWLLFSCAFVGGLAYASYLARRGERSAGDVLLAVTLASQLRRQIEQTVSTVGNAVSGAEALDPYLWLRSHREQAEGSRPDGAGLPDALRHGLTLDDVGFRYPQADRDAVRSVSARLPAGATVAVVGEYGSGKTSLVKLLCGFYEPTRGRITVDGVPLRDLDPAAWRARVSAAFQDFGRYRTTLREAVGVGDLSRADDERAVLAAVRDGDAQPVVERLTDGLDTLLGKDFGGTDLSEGQWQRVALARSAMRPAPLLLVLDEPTAALDAPSEYAVFRRHRSIARRLAAEHGTITVIVSHRLPTVRDADLILVMEDGALIEAGSHEHLLSLRGRYAELLALHRQLHSL